MENTENNGQIVSLTIIEQALEKENITKQIIAKLKSDYSGLKINGIDDVDGFNKVDAARKHCKTVRVTASKICKLGREKSIQEQKDWISKEKEVVGEVSEIEDELELEADRIKLEKEKILFEAAQLSKLPARKEKLLTIGIEVEDSELLKIDDFNFDKLFNEFYVKHLEEIAEKAKTEAAELAKKESERVAAEKKLAEEKAETERVEAKRIADEKAEEQRLENERLKKENEEKDRLAAEQKSKAEADLKEFNRLAKIESDKQVEILLAEQKENARLRAEQKEKADAEKLELERIEEEKRLQIVADKQAELAPDKIKLQNYVSCFRVTFDLSLNSKESEKVKKSIDEKFNSFIKWCNEQIETI